MFTWQCHYQNQDFRPIIGQNQHFPGHHLATHFFQGFGCSWYIYIYVWIYWKWVILFNDFIYIHLYLDEYSYIYICILLMVNSRKLHWIDRSIEFDRYIYGLCKWGKRNPEATSYFEPTSPDSPGTCSSSEADLVSWRRQRWQSMRIVGIVHTRLNVSIIIIIYTSMRTTHA